MPRVLTEGTPWKVIVTFALPLLIGNVVQQLYQFADAVVVGRQLGVTSLASVGATTSLIFLLIGFAWGLTSGFAIPTAQAFGAGDARGVRRSVTSGAWLTAGTSTVLTGAGVLLAEPALHALRTPPELIEQSAEFARMSFLGITALMFFNFLAAIIRAIGDSRTPLVFLIISCGLNVALVIVFVGPFGWGVTGAALATVTAQATSVGLCLVHIRRRIPVLVPQREDWKVTRSELAHHLRLGLPVGFQTSIIAIGSLAVQIRLNELGPDAVAAYTTAARVDGLAVALLQSIGLSVSMFVAQNLGARRSDRILQGVNHGLVVATIASVIIGVTIIMSGGWLVQMFVGDSAPEVVTLASQLLQVYASLYTILGVLFVVRGALQGLGKTSIPFFSGIAELVMRVLTAIVLGGAFGFAGVIWGTPLAWTGAVLILVPAYLKARKSLMLRATSETPLVPLKA